MTAGAEIEVVVLGEHHLEAYAAGLLDPPTREAIEAYLLHHPDARRRVAIYRGAPPGSPRRRNTTRSAPHEQRPPYRS